MKKFKRVITLILSCVLIACTLALFAACKVKENEDGRVSKKDKIIGSWFCAIPDTVNDASGVPKPIDKPTGYESVCKAEVYITVEYNEQISDGYRVTTHYWWANSETGSRYNVDGKARVLLVETDKVSLNANQYYYASSFYTYYEGEGYTFTLNDINSHITATSIVDSSKILSFARTSVTLEDYVALHKEWCERTF